MIFFRRKDKVSRAHTAALGDEDSARAKEQLAKSESQIVDLATRLVRLEAEVGIYRPLFINEPKGSE